MRYLLDAAEALSFSLPFSSLCRSLLSPSLSLSLSLFLSPGGKERYPLDAAEAGACQKHSKCHQEEDIHHLHSDVRS